LYCTFDYGNNTVSQKEPDSVIFSNNSQEYVIVATDDLNEIATLWVSKCCEI